jgi:Domain of unknown function (DUF4157)
MADERRATGFAGAADHGPDTRGPAPGRATLTSRWAPAPASSSGAPLPGEVRTRFESSLGADLSAVRVHTGGASAEAAQAIGARAYAVGNDIHFGAGQYAPADPFGVHLLAHEVAHTQQQAGGTAAPQAKLEVSAPGDACEADADRAADAMVRGEPARVGASSVVVARRPDDDPESPGPTPALPLDQGPPTLRVLNPVPGAKFPAGTFIKLLVQYQGAPNAKARIWVSVHDSNGRFQMKMPLDVKTDWSGKASTEPLGAVLNPSCSPGKGELHFWGDQDNKGGGTPITVVPIELLDEGTPGPHCPPEEEGAP